MKTKNEKILAKKCNQALTNYDKICIIFLYPVADGKKERL